MVRLKPSPLDQLPTASWGLAAQSVIKPIRLSRGTLLSVDLAKTKAMCEEVLGFQCEMIDDGRMLCRHEAVTSDGSPYWLLDVRAATGPVLPQKMTNHWGIWVPTIEDVDRGYQILRDNQERYGLLRVHKPRYAHEGLRDYSCYFEDISGNWWEIDKHPEEDEFIKFFDSGDWDSPTQTATDEAVHG